MEAGRGAERPEESLPPPLRHSRYWAVAALLLLLTSLWLPWWVVWYEDDVGFRYASTGVRVFDPETPETTAWAPHVTGALAAVVTLWLFLRIAGRSHAYEPAVWTRDLRLQAGGIVLALASTLLWPDEVDVFWGGRTFRMEGLEFTEAAAPGLGWWLALLAAVALGAAWGTARRRGRPPERSSDPP